MRRRFRYVLLRLLFILSILGPGFITANVDNDAGGIYTYISSGAQFGYSLLWTMIPVAISWAKDSVNWCGKTTASASPSCSCAGSCYATSAM